jgi:hypothetical protein
MDQVPEEERNETYTHVEGSLCRELLHFLERTSQTLQCLLSYFVYDFFRKQETTYAKECGSNYIILLQICSQQNSIM